MREINITINGRMVCWLVIALLHVAFIAWYQGMLTFDVPVSPSSGNLVMTEPEARLTRQAIELVRSDVVNGSLRSTELTKEALSALLPRAVLERVLNELGSPDMDSMRDALDVLEGKIVVRE